MGLPGMELRASEHEYTSKWVVTQWRQTKAQGKKNKYQIEYKSFSGLFMLILLLSKVHVT